VRILVYGLNFAPEPVGVGKYTAEMAASLADGGHEVRVVAAPPYYPAWRVGQGYTTSRYRREDWRGILVIRCPVYVPDRPGGIRGVLHLGSFALSSLPVVLGSAVWRPDLVWVVEPPLLCAPGALAAARLADAGTWLHIQDFEVDVAFDFGLVRGRLLRAFVTAVERLILRRFDRVSTISDAMMGLAERKGVARDRLRLFPNWADTDVVASSEGVTRYRQELDLPLGSVVALYSGSMGPKQDLDLLARAASVTKDVCGLVWVYCGDGPGRRDLEAACNGLANVRMLGLQPMDRFPDLLHLADVHLLPQRAAAADLVMPSKMTGMLASGRPIVSACLPDSEAANVVRRCGEVVEPGDAESFAGAVAELAVDPHRRRRLGDEGRNYATRHLSRRRTLSQMAAAFAELARARSRTETVREATGGARSPVSSSGRGQHDG